MAELPVMSHRLRADPDTLDRRAVARRLRCVREAHMAMLGEPEAGIEAFAELLELPAESVRGYESGVADPPAQVLIRLHRVTGTSIDWLLTGADEA